MCVDVCSSVLYFCVCFFFFNDTATTEIYTLSLHDALPIYTSIDPLGMLIVQELYDLVKRDLLKRGKRIAAGVLRYMVHPDKELVELSKVAALKKGRRKLHISNKCLADRLGVTVSNVADAKALVRKAFKEDRKSVV